VEDRILLKFERNEGRHPVELMALRLHGLGLEPAVGADGASRGPLPQSLDASVRVDLHGTETTHPVALRGAAPRIGRVPAAQHGVAHDPDTFGVEIDMRLIGGHRVPMSADGIGAHQRRLEWVCSIVGGVAE
jgi:hypothetical protein